MNDEELNQIAADARNQIKALGYSLWDDAEIDAIIKDACEKAHDKGMCDMAHYVEKVERYERMP